MPEGDTVHKVADRMRPGLEKRALTRVWLRDRGVVEPLTGATVSELAVKGKHFLVCIEQSHVVHVHLGMRGRWHAYDAGAPWQLPRQLASLELATDERRFVCFRAARAELLRRADVATHPGLSRLGPDLAVGPVDYLDVVRRARRAEPRTVSDLLLDQRVACGLGNEYKSELLFLEGVHPRTQTDVVRDETLERLYRRGHELLSANLGPWRRTTRERELARVAAGERVPAEERLWAYGRAGLPCHRCGARIAVARMGDAARPTYWCRRCQPEAV